MRKLFYLFLFITLVGSLSAQTVMRKPTVFKDTVIFEGVVVLQDSVINEYEGLDPHWGWVPNNGYRNFTHTTPSVKQNTIYLTHQPNDLGFGVRYDRQATQESGIYLSASYGNYKIPQGRIDDHIRLALGGISYQENSFLTFGVAYNHYGNTSGNINSRALQDFTCEFGVGVPLNRWSVALRVDVVKYETSIDIGYRF